jgi:hypothetical protein
MTSQLIGMDADEAQRLLSERGLSVRRILYSSLQGVPDADSARVIRARELGNNSIEITVAQFKTRV